MAGQPKGDFESFLSQGGTGQTPQGQSAVWESPSASFTKTGQSSAASSGVARKAAEAKGRDIGAQRDIDVWLQRKGKVKGGNAVSAGKDKEEATAVQSGKTASRCISVCSLHFLFLCVGIHKMFVCCLCSRLVSTAVG